MRTKGRTPQSQNRWRLRQQRLRSARRRLILRNVGRSCPFLLAFTTLLATLLVVSPGAPGQAAATTSGPITTHGNVTINWSSPTIIDPSTALQDGVCTSATFCMAVDDLNRSVAWNGTSWSTPQAIDPTVSINQRGIFSVACASSAMCMAAGTGGTSAYVYQWNGSSWSTATTLDSNVAGLTSRVGNISCPTVAFCMAVDGPDAMTWNGTAWSQPMPVADIHVVNGTSNVDSYYLVSCSSATFCMAGGISSDGAVAIVKSWNGISWSTETGVRESAGSAAVEALSCASDTSCIVSAAVAFFGGFYYSYSFLNGVEQASLPSGSIAPVSCASATFCLGEVPGSSSIEVWDGAVLGGSTPLPLSNIKSVSCPSTTFCAIFDFEGSGSYEGDVLFGDVTTSAWTIEPAPAQPVTSENTVEAISCPTTSFCMAAWNAQQGQAGAQLASWNQNRSSNWQLLSSPAGVTFPQIVNLTCLSPSSCFAFGRQQIGPSIRALAMAWDGQTWAQLGELGNLTANESDIQSASCWSASSCIALGEYWNGVAWVPTAEEWSGSSVPQSIGFPPGGQGPISCVSATFCMVANSTLDSWNGTSWNSTSTSNMATTSIDCVGTAFCMAIGSSPEEWNGSTWNSVGSLPNLTYGASCASTTACVAIDTSIPMGGGLTAGYATWDGSVWEHHGDALPKPVGSDTVYMGAISCATGTDCVAIGDSNVLNPVQATPLAERYGPVQAPLSAPPRYVAFGDSVPYGHGLADPGTDGHDGLSPNQPPSPLAYPTLVASAKNLSLTTRSTYCSLTGDQLTVSGAPMSGADVTGAWKDCPTKGKHPAVFPTEFNAAGWSTPPALVTIQAGADDIDFAGCLGYALGARGFIGGRKCTAHGHVTKWVNQRLTNVTSALDQLITSIGSKTNDQTKIFVLNYYEPIPPPDSFVSDGSQLCGLLDLSKVPAFNQALIIQSALNRAIEQGIFDAEHRASPPPVTLVDISGLMGGFGATTPHGVCTAQPWVFTGSLFDAKFWRAVHPNALGQQAIAQAIGNSYTLSQ